MSNGAFHAHRSSHRLPAKVLALGVLATAVFAGSQTLASAEPQPGNRIADDQYECLPGVDPDCEPAITDYQVIKTSEPPSGSVVYPGQVVTYSLTIVYEGNVVFDLVDVVDDLSGVLPYADLVDGSIRATVDGEEAVPMPIPDDTVLSWKFLMEPGRAYWATYQVMIKPDLNAPYTLVNSVTSNGAPNVLPMQWVWSNCVAGDEPECASVLTSPMPGLIVTYSSDPPSGSQVSAGQEVAYAATAQNSGTTVLDDVTLTIDMTNVLDSAAFEALSVEAMIDGLPASSPKLIGSMLTWQGRLDPEQMVIITYKVIVDKSTKPGTSLVSKITGNGVAVAPDDIVSSWTGQVVTSNCSTGDEPGCVNRLTSRQTGGASTDTGGASAETGGGVHSASGLLVALAIVALGFTAMVVVRLRQRTA